MDVGAEKYLSLRAMRVNADNSSKRAVVFFWAIFIAALIILFVTSQFGPDTYLIKTNRSELMGTSNMECSNPVNFVQGLVACQAFSVRNPKVGLLMKQVSTLNQFALIEFILIPHTNFSLPAFRDNITAELVSLIPEKRMDETTFRLREEAKVSRIDFDFQSDLNELTQVFDENGKEFMGFQVPLGFFRDFRRDYYLLVITVSRQTAANFHIVARATLINSAYTLFILVLRCFFLAISIICTIIYLLRMRTVTHKLPEQRCVLLLSISLVVFNDPSYVIGLFFPNFLSLIFSILAMTQFVIVLIFAWGYFLEKILAAALQRPMSLSLLKKVFMVIILTTCLIVIVRFNLQLGSYAYNQTPIIPMHKQIEWLSFGIFILFTIVFTYFLSLYLRVLQHYRNVIWRHRLLLAFNAFFMVLLFVFIQLGQLSLYEQAQVFEIFYASMNLYVVYLQYMYSFASNTPQEESLEIIPPGATKFESEMGTDINLDERKTQF